MEARLVSRCRGLLEVHSRRADEPLTFLHRTVAESLKSGNIWAYITQLTTGTVFNLSLARLSSCLSSLKLICSPDVQDLMAQQGRWAPLARHFLKYSNVIDDSASKGYFAYVDGFHRVMECCWSSSNP